MKTSKNIFLVFSFLVLSAATACVPFPHLSDELSVHGIVYDDVANRPLKGVKVEVEIPSTFGHYVTRTNKDGKFRITSRGQWRYLYRILPDERVEKVRIKGVFKHGRFERETIEDSFLVPRDGQKEVNFGYIYLVRR